MTEIYLHGLAAHKFGGFHKFVNIHKASDCIKAIDANREGFMQYFISKAQKEEHYEIIVDEQPIESINEAFQKKQIKRIDIVPIIKGNVDFLIQVVVQVLIAAIMAGIQYLMTPIPEEEPRSAIARVAPASYMFANRQNVTAQYTPVPLGYGALRIGTKIIESIVNPVDLTSEESRLTSDIAAQQVGGSAANEDGVGGGAY